MTLYLDTIDFTAPSAVLRSHAALCEAEMARLKPFDTEGRDRLAYGERWDILPSNLRHAVYRVAELKRIKSKLWITIALKCGD